MTGKASLTSARAGLIRRGGPVERMRFPGRRGHFYSGIPCPVADNNFGIPDRR